MLIFISCPFLCMEMSVSVQKQIWGNSWPFSIIFLPLVHGAGWSHTMWFKHICFNHLET